MKHFMIAVVAFSLVAGTAASAREGRRDSPRDRYEQSYNRGDRQRYERPRANRPNNNGSQRRDGYRGADRSKGWENRRWTRGQRLPGAYRGYGVDYRRHHLRRPPRGYQWVQIGNDYVLTAVATGLILDVITGGY